MEPTIGRIVHLKLSKDQVEQINRRRTTGSSIYDRIQSKEWPIGAQAHIGNPISEGELVPMIITKVWPHEYGVGQHGVNGQAVLDGNDVLWITSAKQGTEPGQWQWPTRS